MLMCVSGDGWIISGRLIIWLIVGRCVVPL